MKIIKIISLLFLLCTLLFGCLPKKLVYSNDLPYNPYRTQQTIENHHNNQLKQRYERVTVLPASKLDAIGRQYIALKSSNLRTSPTTKSNIIGGLQRNETFYALGKVKNKEWIVVGKGNQTIGYVYAPLVQEYYPQNKIIKQHSKASVAIKPAETDTTMQTNLSINLDELEAAEPINLDELGAAEPINLDQLENNSIVIPNNESHEDNAINLDDL